MPYQAILNGETLAIDIAKRRPTLCLKVGDTLHSVADADCPASGAFTFVIDGQVKRGWRYATDEEVYVRFDGETYIVGLPQFGAAAAAAGHNDDEARADMPGTVVSLHCAEGDAVTEGQKLVTVESMKLQVSLTAPRDGTVAKIHFAANATFDRGAVLVSLAPLGAK